jgi:hypothetical protein
MAALGARPQPDEWNGVGDEQAGGREDTPQRSDRLAPGMPGSVAILFRRLREAAAAHDDD